MSDLPNGWSRASVGKVLRIEYGKGLPDRDRDRSGSIPVYGSAGEVGKHSSAIVKGPVLVIGRKGNVGSTYLSQGPCWPIDTAYFAQIPTGIAPRYFAYQLQSMRLKELDSSTAVPSLRRESLEKQTLAIAPTAEQERIVAVVEEQFSRLEAGVAALERVQRNLKRMRAGLLKAAFLVPAGTTIVSAKELFRWSSGKRISDTMGGDGGFPVFGGNGITGRSSRSLTTEDTLVIGRVGAHCGNVYLTGGPAWITDNAIYAQSHADSISLSYALLAFQAARLRDRAAGTGQPFVNQKILNDVEISVPSIASQNAIVAAHDAGVEVIARIEGQLHMLRQRRALLRSSILAAAFSGMLVPQDSKDEPASVLLKRIAAELASSSGYRPARARSQPRRKVTV